MRTFTINEMELQEEANKIKDLIIEVLASEGLLRGTPEEIGSDFVVTIRKKGMFGNFFDKIFTISEDDTQYKILKSIKRKKSKSYNKFLKIVKKQQEEDEKE